MTELPFFEEPRPRSPLAHRLAYSLLLLAIGAVLFSPLLPAYRGVVSFVAALLGVAGLTVFGKYVAPQYRYSVERGADGAPTFVVSAKIGRRVTTFFSASLAELAAVEPETKADRRAFTKAHRAEKSAAARASRYFWFQTMAPDTSYRLTFRDGDRVRTVHIECSDDFAARLRDLR